MEAQKEYISADSNSRIMAWVLIAACFLIYYSVMTMLSPGKKYRELQKEYGVEYDEKNPVDERILSDSVYLTLLKQKAFLQARVALAASDSIYLSVNLKDSLLSLEINGVSVHKADIKSIAASRMLKVVYDHAILSMLSVPFTVSRNFSSIEKEPLMIKLAPRDTSEYEPDIIPDTAYYEPVNFIMEMENGTRLYIYQAEKVKPGDGLRLFLFDLKYRIRSEAARFARIITFRIPEYHPYIKLKVPRSDARIIYRALPWRGQAAVSF